MNRVSHEPQITGKRKLFKAPERRYRELSESISSLSCRRLLDTVCGVILDCRVAAAVDVQDVGVAGDIFCRHKNSVMQITYRPQSQPANSIGLSKV